MKNIKKILIVLSLILIISLTIILLPKGNKNLDDNTEIKNVGNGMLSIMLEKSAGSNEYVESSETSFIQENYNFNAKLSKCVNGSKLKYNEKTKNINVETSKTDKCYLYFDNINVKNNFTYTENYETYIAPSTGTYKIELWGASGYSDKGGKGAYVVGNLELEKGETIYVYVGEKGKNISTFNREPMYTFNGGGSGALTCYDNNAGGGSSYFGGGATDVRLKNGTWDNFEGLKSRIMVAAGGGGGYNSGAHYAIGGAGGALEGFDGQQDTSEHVSSNWSGFKATQTSGGDANGSFGKGGQAVINTVCNFSDGAGGGGGYYGGGGSRGNTYNRSSCGAGGSSFISGHPGCNAIDEKSTEEKIIHTDQPNHYSGKVFTETNMIAGTDSMPKPEGGTEEGHTGSGYVKITLVK